MAVTKIHPVKSTLSELAGQTAHNVARSARSWEQYLDTASRLYKYPFDEQLLIYAQRPDATACASMELWNGTMRRWVRSGSSGIALIRKSGGRPHLEYVFDVSDTRPVEGARTPWLWELREEHHAAVVAALERRYGPTEESGIANQLMDLAEYAVREVYRDHLRDLAYDAEGSLLDGLDDLNLEVRFRNLMTASVQYTLLRRCGLNPSDYLDDDDLAGITEFTTPAVLHHLGEAVSSVSKDLLMEIGRSIRAYEQEARKNRENNLEKPLANQAVIGYTEVTRNFSTLNHESAERSDTHERDEHDRADVHEGRGLSDSRSGDGQRGRSGGDASGQVRDAAGELPEAGASRDVHLDAADGAVGAAPAGDRPAGAGAGRQDRERPDEARRRERGAESEQSDGVGAGGQQLHGAGRGNGADGDRLQVTTEQAEHEAAGEEPAASLSMEPDASDAEEPAPPRFSLFPTVEEQVEAIIEAQAEEKRTAAEEPAQIRLDGADRIPDAVIGRALTAGSNERDSIKRIVAHFQKDYPIANSAAFLKEEFGTGGKGVTIAGQKYALWYNGEGVHIAAGNRALTPNSTTISWTDAALLISDLLRKGMYATQENIDGARGNEFEELAQKLAYMRQDFSEEAREHGFLPSIESAYSGNGYPEITLQITELLRKPESRAAIVSELRQFADSYALNGDLLRFRRIHDPETLWARLSDLDKPIAEFHAVEAFEPVRASFITEDEIDELLKRSGANRIDDGKLSLLRSERSLQQPHHGRPKEAQKPQRPDSRHSGQRQVLLRKARDHKCFPDHDGRYCHHRPGGRILAAGAAAGRSGHRHFANVRSVHQSDGLDAQLLRGRYFPRKIKETELFIEALSADLPILQAHPVKDDAFSMTVLGTTYTERKDAGQAIVNACMLMTDPDKPMELGEYRGFPMVLQLSGEKFKVTMKQHLTYTAELSNDLLGNVLRINNALEQIPKNLEAQKLGLTTLQTDMESAKEEAARPFPQDKELEEKSARLSQLNLELDNEEKSQGKSAEATEDAPARDSADEEDTPPEKPSIRAQLRAFTPPARVTAGTERAYSRGTEL